MAGLILTFDHVEHKLSVEIKFWIPSQIDNNFISILNHYEVFTKNIFNLRFNGFVQVQIINSPENNFPTFPIYFGLSHSLLLANCFASRIAAIMLPGFAIPFPAMS